MARRGLEEDLYMRRLLIKLLCRAVLSFLSNVATGIDYKKGSNSQVIGGGSNAFFSAIPNDPRGSHLGVQIRWSFEDRPWGDVCGQYVPDKKVEI